MRPYIRRIIELLEKSDKYSIEVRLVRKNHLLTDLPCCDGVIKIRIKGNIVFEWIDDRQWKSLENHDMAHPHHMACKHIHWIPNCSQILKLQYNPYMLKDFYKISPAPFYPPYNIKLVDAMRVKLRKVRLEARDPSLRWRGEPRANRRPLIRKLVDSGLINDDAMGDKIPIEKYYEEIGSHRIILSLPGNGDRCHREVEAFAFGTPVIMPECTNILTNELKPNVHYIPIPRNRIDGETVTNIYNRVVGNLEFLEYIRNNALNWYEKNCTLETGPLKILKALGIMI